MLVRLLQSSQFDGDGHSDGAGSGETYPPRGQGAGQRFIHRLPCCSSGGMFSQVGEIWYCDRSLFTLQDNIFVRLPAARSGDNAGLKPSHVRIGIVPFVDQRTPSLKVASITAGYYCPRSIPFDHPVSCS
jgi:hypothetical protein